MKFKTTKHISLLLIVFLCLTMFTGCGAEKKLFDVCGADAAAWAKSYDTAAPDALTVYIEHGGITEDSQSITNSNTINEVFSALCSVSVKGSPDKGPIDFTVAPATVIYSFRASDGGTVSFTFLDHQLAVGDPIRSDGLLYTCSGVDGLFSIDGIDLSSLNMDASQTADPTITQQPAPQKGDAEYAVFTSEKQDFSFLYDSAYTAIWDDDNGATIYTEQPDSIPYLLVYRNIGNVSGFDAEQSFKDKTAALQAQYGSRLIDIGAFQTYTINGKPVSGVLYTYTLDSYTIEMLALIELTEDSLIQYTCKYVQGNSDATMKALAEAVASYQPDAAYYTYDYTKEDEPSDQPTAPQAEPQATLKLTKYDGDFFTVMLPEGWQLQTMGEYATFSFRAWDPDNPDYEIFYYGNITPFMKSEAARQWNENMSAITQEGSTYHLFADAPAADEHDVSSIFYNFYAYKKLVEKYTGTYFSSGISIPTLRSFAVIEQLPIQTALSSVCSSEALIYASLQADSGTNCYGKFSASLYSAPSVMYDNIDMSFIAALGVTGVIAPQSDFEQVEQILSQAAFSLTFTQAYVDEAKEAGEDDFNKTMVNNQTTQAAYDAYNAAWDAYIRQ